MGTDFQDYNVAGDATRRPTKGAQKMKLIKEFLTLEEAQAFMDRDRRDLFCERCMFSGRYQIFDMG